MAEMVNPYIAGAPVTEARMFFGREDVFEWIQNSLTGRYTDHILVIHGQRRVGKTSVLKQLGNRLPEKYIPVFFDLQGRTHTTLDRFLWWLARETVRVLKQDRSIEVPAPEKEDFARDPEYFENTFLSGLQPFLGEHSLLYTFDEFDNLEESEVKEELAWPLIDHLRRLMGREELNFIFSIGSSGRKLENMRAAYTEFFKTALYKKITFLSEEQTHNLVTCPVEGLLEFDHEVVRHIYELTSGHPYFTQLTCHELFARCQRTGEPHVKDADLESILEDVVERGTVNLKFTWDEATDLEKWSLAALAQLDKTDNRSLSDFLRKQRVRFSESNLTSSLLHLQEKDIITQGNRFVIYLLKLWLQKNRPIERVREELTEVNPIANRYIEIGLELRDSGQYDKAVESFREALAIAKDNIQAQVNIALVYMDQGAYDKAVIEFEKALAIDDEDVVARSGLCDVYLALGHAAMQMGRMKEAAQSYQRVLAINEEHTEARQRLAEINSQRAEEALAEGRDEEALVAFTEALKYAPEDGTLAKRVKAVEAEKKDKVLAALVARSEKEAGVKSWGAAIQTLEEAQRLAPDNADIQKRLAQTKNLLRENNLVLLRAKAQGFAKAEKNAEALKTWQEYLSLEPEDRAKVEGEVAHLQLLQKLGGIYSQAQEAISGKQYDKAISLLKEIILQDENFKDASRLLVQAVETRRSRLPHQFKGIFSTILKGLFTVAVVSGFGIGGYFAWQEWGDDLRSAFANAAPAPTVSPTATLVPKETLILQATATAVPLPYTWVRLNSGQFLPRDIITAIVVNPNDAGVMYVGTQNAGIYKSIDGGLSWQSANKGLNRAMISTLAIDPENSNTLYAATRSARLFVTRDAGNSWVDITPASAQPSDARTYILVDSQNPTYLYYSDSFNIFRSSDRGFTWLKINFWCFSAIDAITYQNDSTGNPAFYISTDSNPTNCEPGIYRTADLGTNWEYIGPDKAAFWKLLVSMDQEGNQMIMGLRGYDDLSTSLDDGISWTTTNLKCTALYTNASKTVLCGRDDGLSISKDWGRSWENLVGMDKQVSAIWASDDLTNMLLGTPEGLIFSNDGGKTWSDRSTGFGARRLELDLSPYSSQLFIRDRTQGPIGPGHSCCNSLNELYASSDGQAWELVTSQGYGFAIDADGATLYRAQGNDLLISSDDGSTWKKQIFPFWADRSALSLFAHPKQSGVLYAFDDGPRTLFISENGGQTWNEYNPQEEHLALVQLYFGREKIAYMVPFYQAFRSVDNGKTWVECGQEIEQSFPIMRRLAIDPRDDSRIFAASIENGLLFSDNACQSWETRDNGLENLFINSITIDPVKPDVIYLGTDSGAYISFDNGLTWGRANDGLFGTAIVYSIVVDRDGHVYAATPNGIFKLEGK